MLELKTIDKTNRKAVEALTVAEDQEQYIASNRESLKTAEEEKAVARPFAICADGEIVGFTMFAFDLDYEDTEDRYWLWRLMIDKNLQGRGYGSAALHKIIDYFNANGAGYIKLSTKPTNRGALSLYHRFGFLENGEMNGEEVVLRLEL